MPDDRKPMSRLERFRAELAAYPELRASVDRWLKENPPREGWCEDPDAWAFLEMPLPGAGASIAPSIPWLARGAS